jgi:hypothetical protein
MEDSKAAWTDPELLKRFTEDLPAAVAWAKAKWPEPSVRVPEGVTTAARIATALRQVASERWKTPIAPGAVKDRHVEVMLEAFRIHAGKTLKLNARRKNGKVRLYETALLERLTIDDLPKPTSSRLKLSRGAGPYII